MNPHLDAVLLTHAGRTATLRFTWRALHVLQRDWGDDWRERLFVALDKEKPDDMAALIALLSGMTADEVMDWSPPLTMAGQACMDAYAILKLGRKDVEAGEHDPANPLKGVSLLSRMSAALRFAQGWVGGSSGTAPPTQRASS